MPLKPCEAGHHEEGPGEGRIVFDDEDDAIGGREPRAVIGKLARWKRRAVVDRLGRLLALGLHRHLHVRERQVQRERAALPRLALDADLAAEEARELAADRQAEPCSAVATRGGAVGLLEGLEDELLLVLRDAEAGVLDRECDHVFGRIRERRRRVSLSRRRQVDVKRDAALVGELEGIAEQVTENLQDALAVGFQRDGDVGVDVEVEVDLLLGRHRLEGRLELLRDVRERNVGRVDLDLAGLDLRQVEHLVDQVEEVRACAVDRLRVLDLLRIEVRLLVVREHAREDEQRIERRAQLVAHVREELALVLGRERQLRRLLFDGLSASSTSLFFCSTARFCSTRSDAFSSSSSFTC